MASGGLYSSIHITIYSPNQLSLHIGHNSQSTVHMIEITCFCYINVPERDLIHAHKGKIIYWMGKSDALMNQASTVGPFEIVF